MQLLYTCPVPSITRNRTMGKEAFIVTPKTDQSPALLNDHTCWPHGLRHRSGWEGKGAGPSRPTAQGDQVRVKHAQSRNYTRVKSVTHSLLTSPAVDVWVTMAFRGQSRLMSKYQRHGMAESGLGILSYVSGAGCTLATEHRAYCSVYVSACAHHVIQDLVSASVPHPTVHRPVPCMTNPY